MKAKERAQSIVTVKPYAGDDYAVVIEGNLRNYADGVVHLTCWRGPESHCRSVAAVLVQLIAEKIIEAEAGVWQKAGVCSVCVKPKSEHPPGPPCVPHVR